MPSFRWSARRDESALADESLAALLAGAQPPEDAPPELRRALDVLAALQAGPARDELADEAAALAEFRISAAWPRPADRPRRRRPRRRSSLAARLATAAAVAVVVIGGVTAAALIGVLPTPLQRVAHDDFGMRPPSAHRSKHKTRPAAWSHRDAHRLAASQPRPGVSDPAGPRHDRCGPVWPAHPRATWTPTMRRDPLRGTGRWLGWRHPSCARWYWRHQHHHWSGWPPSRRRTRLPGRHRYRSPVSHPTPRPGRQPAPQPSRQPAPGRTGQRAHSSGSARAGHAARTGHPRRASSVTRT